MRFEQTGMLRAEMVFREAVEGVPRMKGNGNIEEEGRVVKASYPLM
jgi:NCS2 family nucleobase:cation symporter-2